MGRDRRIAIQGSVLSNYRGVKSMLLPLQSFEYTPCLHHIFLTIVYKHDVIHKTGSRPT